MLSALVLSLFAANVSAQLDEFPRTPSGKPDFSGIWQAMTKAHFDIEPHAAAYGPHPGQMGALSAVPGSQGIVEANNVTLEVKSGSFDSVFETICHNSSLFRFGLRDAGQNLFHNV